MNKRWLLLAVLCLPAQAKTMPWVTENGNVLAWKAVEDDNGGFYLLWTHQEPGSVRVLGQHITAEGSPLWTLPGQTFLPVVNDTAAWTVFSDSNKGLALAWVREGKVWVQRWTPDGQPVWKTPIQVSDTRYDSTSPAAIADGGGGFYVVWAERIPAGRAVLMAQHLNSQSVPLWPVAMRVSLRPSDQRQPAVAFDGAAGLIISWADYRDFASDWRVQRIDFQGFRIWGLEGIEMAAPAGTGSSALRIAPWGQGSLTVAWVDAENGRGYVQDRQISPKGIPLTDKKIAAAPTGDQWNPVLTGDGEGHYWVGWEDNRNDQNWKIYLRRNGADFPLSASSSGDQGRLALAEDGAQGAFAAWIENRNGGASLYAQHLNAAGAEMWEKGGREIAQNLKRPDTPSILPLDSVHTAAFWSDQPVKGQYALYWQLL
jgi:hypothetical protein